MAQDESTEPKATEQFRAQTTAVRDDLGKLGRLAKDAAREKFGEAREAATDYYEQGRKRVGDYETQLVDYVRMKPLKSVLIAAGIGALIGILASRR
jgi:ElaB/YqjD/DUF883 family membrane-anchored ribosome-binding protein